MRNILILFFALFVTGVPARNKTVPGDTISDGRETSLPMITSNIPKSALIHLTEYRKGLYKVSIQDDKSDWRSVEVRNALVSSFSKHPQIWNDWENQKALRDTMSYALFTHHFKRNVKVRIEPGFQFDKVEIRPVSYGIEYKKVDGGIEFELVNASQKVSVEFDGDRAENLFLFPDLPDMDKPDKNESNVLYYGPGQHDVGCIVMKSNQTLYNVTFRNCIVLETPALHDSEEGDDGWRGGCAAINARVGTYEGAGGGGRMSDILFENIRIEDLTGGRPIATEIVSDGENTGSLTGVTFRNITFKGSKFLPAQVRGVSKKFPLRNVTLDNVVFNGKYIRKADNKKYLFINPYIENLQFK